MQTPEQKATAAQKRKAKAAFKRLQKIIWNRAHLRYKITFQWRRPDGLIPGGDPHNWRDWREFGALPLLFPTEAAAWEYISSIDLFKNFRALGRRKPSASVEKIFINRTKAA